MPTEPIDAETMGQIKDALDDQGVPSDLSESMAVAIDAAGFAIVPSEGGAAVQALTALVATTSMVTGKPGWYVHEITCADETVVRIVQIPGAKGQPPQYVRG